MFSIMIQSRLVRKTRWSTSTAAAADGFSFSSTRYYTRNARARTLTSYITSPLPRTEFELMNRFRCFYTHFISGSVRGNRLVIYRTIDRYHGSTVITAVHRTRCAYTRASNDPLRALTVQTRVLYLRPQRAPPRHKNRPSL